MITRLLILGLQFPALPDFATLNLNRTRSLSGGHICGPREAASLLLSAGFLACFMGICGEWQLWNHFSFCQVVVRLSVVSLLYWPLLVNSLENIWFSLFPLKKKKGSSRLPTFSPKQKHITNTISLGNSRGRPRRGRGPDCSQHPNLILMSDYKRSWESPTSCTCSVGNAVLLKNQGQILLPLFHVKTK